MLDIWSELLYNYGMIKSYKSKALSAFALDGNPSKLPVPQSKHRLLARRLQTLNAAAFPEDMNLPGSRFHKLQGSPTRYAVDITVNYRLTWGWSDGAIDVDLEDYH